MIPISLSLSGFLSYRKPVEIDFTAFDLACISGQNGAGKSSLLDAITWALFGQARQRDDSVINTQCDTAEVILVFAYEDNEYRVQRSKPRGKTSVLEFQIRQARDSRAQAESEHGDWKPLTERTLRETQARIESTLRLNYETFVNAAFFLQGKADQFTQQRPGDRKRILGSILGLEVWESYRQLAGERRRQLQAEIDTVEGRLQEIESELAEEQVRTTRLLRLEEDLERLSKARETQEKTLENIRRIAATLAEQRKWVDSLARQLEAANQTQAGLDDRLNSRRQEREAHDKTVSRAEQIEDAYNAWRTARDDLAQWDEIADQFREHERRRSEPLTEIEAARARLEAELHALQERDEIVQGSLEELPGLQNQLEIAQSARGAAGESLAKRALLEEQLQAARREQAEAQAENPRLKAEMEEYKARIDQLESAEGAACPVCGQPLSAEERQNMIADLNRLGKDLGDRFRANKALLDNANQHVLTLEMQIAECAGAESSNREQTRIVDQLTSQIQELRRQEDEWKSDGAARMSALRTALEQDSFAPEARARLREIDTELKAIGYDAGAHDEVRRRELLGRGAEAEFRSLESARAALAPLEREIADLEAQIETQSETVQRLEKEHTRAASELAAAAAQAPDLAAAEQELFDLQEDENRLRLEVGAAQQKVMVLEDLKGRQRSLKADRKSLNHQVSQYRQLERAFGKDGVPALLIEQALPQIETRANEILDRLSGGSMSVRFITQAAYKDKKRDDLRETLDIQISDSVGTRDYEMYSGGEAFRVNFAIRLALSEVLAQRAGARLQTLVVDEGFGSQDAAGRQRLIEAINLVRADFAKILVITHIDELKDAFPNRIEVEKVEGASVVQVI